MQLFSLSVWQDYYLALFGVAGKETISKPEPTDMALISESRLAEMKANDVLNECHDILLQREERYDDFDITAFRTAGLISIISEQKRTPEQWCLDMVATKLARIYNSPDHLDNYIDAICYLAEAAALVKTEKEEI